MKSTVPQRILMVKTHAIGDVLMVTPAIRAVRKAYPRAEITFLTSDRVAPILENNPNIDRIDCFPMDALFRKQPMALLQARRQIAAISAELALVFQPSKAVHLLVKTAGIKHIAAMVSGWDPLVDTKVRWQNNTERYIVDHFCDVPRALGIVCEDLALDIFISDEENLWVKSVFNDHGFDTQPPVAFFPGGGANIRDTVLEKRWAADRFAKIADRMAQRFDVPIVVIVAPEEKEVLREMSKSLKTKAIFFESWNLRQMIAFLASCRAVVTNDSLPLHLAVAFRVPSFTIFGPSNASCLHPQLLIHGFIQSQVHCSPCYANEPFPGCSDFICMEKLDINDVWKAVYRWMLDAVMMDS